MEAFGDLRIVWVFLGERRELERFFDEPERASGAFSDEFPDVVDEVGSGGGLQSVFEGFFSGRIVFVFGLCEFVAENLF